MDLSNVISLLNEHGIHLSSKVYNNLLFELNNRNNNGFRYRTNHICFLICNKSKSILSYGLNYFLKSNKYPFSIHSEVNTVNKYYKKQIDLSKKIMFIFKISKSGVLGNSKPCKQCSIFLSNIIPSINITKIYYSINDTELDLITPNMFSNIKFKNSSGITKH